MNIKLFGGIFSNKRQLIRPLIQPCFGLPNVVLDRLLIRSTISIAIKKQCDVRANPGYIRRLFISVIIIRKKKKPRPHGIL